MKIFQISVLLMLSISVDCVRPRPPRPKRKFAGKNDFVLPKHLTMLDFQKYNIPNVRFCEDMQMKPLTGLLLPWWHNYCEELKERNEKGNPLSASGLSGHHAVLNRIKRYKKAQAIKKAMLRAINNIV